MPVPDPRDAEIAALKAALGEQSLQTARLLTDVEQLTADLAAHNRALAAGPARLRAVALQARAAGETPLADGALDCASMVEAAQEAAMKEGM